MFSQDATLGIDWIVRLPAPKPRILQLLADIASFAPSPVTVYDFEQLIASIDQVLCVTSKELRHSMFNQSTMFADFSKVAERLDSASIEGENTGHEQYRQQWQEAAAKAWLELQYPECHFDLASIVLSADKFTTELAAMLGYLGKYFHRREVVLSFEQLSVTDSIRTLWRWDVDGVVPAFLKIIIRKPMESADVSVLKNQLADYIPARVELHCETHQCHLQWKQGIKLVHLLHKKVTESESRHEVLFAYGQTSATKGAHEQDKNIIGQLRFKSDEQPKQVPFWRRFRVISYR